MYASEKNYPLLTKLGEELRFILITSSATVFPLSDCPSDLDSNQELGIAIDVRACAHIKCDRCWHRRADVGQDSEHPTLCMRCVTTINGEDDMRQFA